MYGLRSKSDVVGLSITRHTSGGYCRALLFGALFSFALLAFARPAAASHCLIDTNGANDVPGQKDVTEFCSGMGAGSPFDLQTSANFDLTGLSGGNTADLCLLFDSDSDNRINLALCTTLSGSPAVLSKVRLLSCNDGGSNRCSGAVQLNVCSGSSTSCLSDADCPSGHACAKQFETFCEAGQEAKDPFATGDNSPLDTVISCSIDLDEFGAAGATARLINMGTLSSSSLSSSFSDSILPPACGHDADCAHGQICHVPSGECYTPPPTGCTDNDDCTGGLVCEIATGNCVPGGCTSDADCVAGKVCNLETGACETPTDNGCESDDDCAIGLVCDVATGDCVEPTTTTVGATTTTLPVSTTTVPVTTSTVPSGCTSNADCAAGEVCNNGVCEPAPATTTLPPATTTTVPNGGCSTDEDCATGEVCSNGVCEPAPVTTTVPSPTTTVPSGCTGNADCATGEVCSNGVCEPSVTTTTLPGACTDNSDCASGEICNEGTCEPPVGPCEDDADCPEGAICNLESHVCVPGAPCADDTNCDGLDSFCGVGFCDPGNQTCAIEPQNEGQSCTEDNDVCTVGNVCQGGACVGVPLCDPQCSICNAGECLSMCGNPFHAESTGITITDALNVLRVAVDLEDCAVCVCDVNHTNTVTAVDALAVERLVVRLPGVLDCPSPVNATTTTTIEDSTTTTLP